MDIEKYKRKNKEKWDNVRPVLIYFSGERFRIVYNSNSNDNGNYIDPFDHSEISLVAMVHSYLGNVELTQVDQ